MLKKPFLIFVASAFLGSTAFSNPLPWSELNQRFSKTVSLNRKLSPHYTQQVEFFFRHYFFKNPEQLLHVEKSARDTDSVLDFFAFNCAGVITKLVPRGTPQRVAKIQNAVDHLSYHLIQALDLLSYEDLCEVLHQSMQGKDNFFHTLVDKNIVTARNRFFYFLIEKTFKDFADRSHIPTHNSPSLHTLVTQALSDRKMDSTLRNEQAMLLTPLFNSWEEIQFNQIDDFLEISIARRELAYFLGCLLGIAAKE